MIVTLTPNPSLDRTLEIDTLVRGSVLRAGVARAEPGGKGVNVARALAANGRSARALLPLGGAEGDHLALLLGELGLDVYPVPIAAPTRTNVSLVEPNGTVTKINAPGPTLTPAELDALHKSAIAALEGASWLAACGSLPPGAPVDLFAAIARAARDAGVRVAVDTAGDPLEAAIAAGVDVIKPNVEELSAAVGLDLVTMRDVAEAAGVLRSRGARSVLVSMGRDGAILVDDAGAIHAESSPVTPRSNVGAGDATLAGYLAAGGSSPESLLQAVAWGTGAVGLPGTAMPGPADLDMGAVRVKEIDHDRKLDEPGGSL